MFIKTNLLIFYRQKAKYALGGESLQFEKLSWTLTRGHRRLTDTLGDLQIERMIFVWILFRDWFYSRPLFTLIILYKRLVSIGIYYENDDSC